MRAGKKISKDSSESIIKEPVSATAEVIRCMKLNIRKEPNPKAEVIGILNAGTKVVVNLTSKFDQYYEILDPSGKKGYAMKTYLSIIS